MTFVTPFVEHWLEREIMKILMIMQLYDNKHLNNECCCIRKHTAFPVSQIH